MVAVGVGVVVGVGVGVGVAVVVAVAVGVGVAECLREIRNCPVHKHFCTCREGKAMNNLITVVLLGAIIMLFINVWVNK